MRGREGNGGEGRGAEGRGGESRGDDPHGREPLSDPGPMFRETPLTSRPLPPPLRTLGPARL